MRPSTDPAPGVRADVAPRRILVADDDAEMREALAAALRRDGYVVVEARDGNEVLDRVKESSLCDESGPPLDAVVTDIRMPGRSGLDALIAIRAVAPDLPVVMITAFGDAETHAEARWMGATALLDKLFDADELRAVLARLAPARGRNE